MKRSELYSAEITTVFIRLKIVFRSIGFTSIERELLLHFWFLMKACGSVKKLKVPSDNYLKTKLNHELIWI